MPAYIPKSKTDNWQTPKELYDSLNKEFNFDCDPCPINYTNNSPDGLLIEWGKSTFCNPPYSKTKLFIKKAYEEWKKGKNIVLLINAITDTIAFHKYIYNQAEIRFIKGRIKFINPEKPELKTPNVRPSMIVIFKIT
jgi:site-specific DNA-methyltransferase (adenine-specific)